MMVLFQALSYFEWGTFMAIALAGIVGAVLVMLTREDAFDAADRKSKMTWFVLLLGSALAIYLATRLRLPFLTWVGIVIIGVYWFDVRPHIKDILGGRPNSW